MFTITPQARRPALLLAAGLLLAAWPATASAQMGAGVGEGGRIELPSTTEAARAEFWAGLTAASNIHFTSARHRLMKALELDESLGLARVLWATLAQNISQENRTAELNRGVVDAAHGTPGELAFAAALRAQALNRHEEARTLFATAQDLLANDPNVAYWAGFSATPPGTPAYENALVWRGITERFPDFAPAHNILAYTLYASGDESGALQAVAAYARLVPNHPNPHDSYGDILKWEGRLDEAATHFQRAAELDPTFVEASVGLAEVRHLQGRGDEARSLITAAIGHASTPQERTGLHRRLAISYLLDGKIREARAELNRAVEIAGEASLDQIVRGTHRDMAIVDGLGDRGREVGAHLAAATAPDAGPAVQVQNAILFAAGGHTDVARTTLATAMSVEGASEDGYVQSHAPIARAMVLMQEGNIDGALAELVKGDRTTDLAAAVAALCENARGNRTEARRIRDQILSEPDLDYGQREEVVARLLVKRVK